MNSAFTGKICLLSVLFLFLILIAFPLAAQTSYITIDDLDVLSTEVCIGISASYTGTPRADTVGYAQYREAGSTDWLPGAELAQAIKSPTNRFIGSIFCLEPGTSYDVRVLLKDSTDILDIAQVAVSTSAWQFPEDTGNTYYVATNGNDSWPGTDVFSWATLQHAVDSVNPGDTIIIKPGVYQQQCTITRSGTQGHPITIKGEHNPKEDGLPEGEMTVIDGSNPSLAHAGNWNYVSSGQYYTLALGQEPHLVFVEYQGEPVRLFNHGSLSEFMDGSFNTIFDGWYYSGGILYVRLPAYFGDCNPASHSMRINTYSGSVNDWNAVTVHGDWINIMNLKIEYAYYGIHCKGPDHVRLADNDIRYFKRGIIHRGGGSFNIYEKNYLEDTLEIFQWPWEAGKTGIQETCAIRFILEAPTQTGTCNIVRHNETFGVTNGFYCNTAHSDIYENTVFCAADDAIELDCHNLNDGSAYYTENLRVFGNCLNDVFTGISLSPGRGLIYLVDNAVTRFKRMGIKVTTSTPSTGPFRILNNTFWSDYNLSCGNYAFRMDAPMSHAQILNNIFCATQYAVYDVGNSNTDSIRFDNNCFWSWNNNTFFRWRNIYYDNISELRNALPGMVGTLNMEADSLLADPYAALADLTAGSPCIDQGALIDGLHREEDVQFGLGYSGLAPDMGCAEHMEIIIIDDLDPAFKLLQMGGARVRITWHSSSYLGRAKYTPAGTGEKLVMWQTDNLLALPGLYEVYVYKFRHPYLNLMASNVRYRVCHAQGNTECFVDQSTCEADTMWESIGTFEFDASGGLGVQLSDQANGFVIADAVKFVYIGESP